MLSIKQEEKRRNILGFGEREREKEYKSYVHSLALQPTSTMGLRGYILNILISTLFDVGWCNT